MRYLTVATAFLLTLLGVGAIAAAAVIVFAGPHSDILPMPLQIATYILAWVAVLGLPVFAARAVWRRTGR